MGKKLWSSITDDARIKTGLTQRLAEFVLHFRADQVPQEILENAKIAILDCLGVSLLAASEEIGKTLMRFARKNLGAGPCTVWGSELLTTTQDAALMNATLAHGLDYDEKGHASTYTLAAATSLAERYSASGRKLLEAFIVGREVRMSLDPLFAARFRGVGPGARGWNPNGVPGSIAAVCAASKVLDLGGQQILNAVGLAAGSCGAMGRDGGTMAKPFRAGQAAMTGVTCALLASEGFTGDETALEAPYGLLQALGPVDQNVLDSLGKSIGSEYNLSEPVKVKQFPAAAVIHGGVEAAFRLVRKRPISSSDVDSIECDLHPYPLVRTRPKRGFEGLFSMSFCLAIALVYGRLTPADFSDDRIQDPLVLNLIQRVRHVPDLKSLIIRLKNGERFDEPIRPPSGLVGLDEVQSKFNQCVSKALPDSKRLSLLDLVTHLDEIPNVKTLTDSLHVPTNPC